MKVKMQGAEHIAAFFTPFSADSLLAGVSPADVHNRDPRDLPLVAGGVTTYGDGVLASSGNIVFFQLPPFQVSGTIGMVPAAMNLRRTFGRTSFALSRLLGNFGVSAATPLLERFGHPVGGTNEQSTGRWLDGLYLTKPTEWDDPYRFFGW